jgi:flagellar basal body rod protein FlgG
MNIGIYQSASALSALERWQESVAQNITSSQTSGFRKRTINFSTQSTGELRPDMKSRIGRDPSMAMSFPKVNYGINFTTGETQPTRRELDVAIQGDGFFEVQRNDGSKVYTRSGEFRMRADRVLVTTDGHQVMSDGGAPLTLTADGGPVTINRDGSISQGQTAVGRIAVKRFENNAALTPLAGGFFVPAPGVEGQRVDGPDLLQGYVEGSNESALREMVDLVLIARAYEANEKMIRTVDEQMGKTLEALG